MTETCTWMLGRRILGRLEPDADLIASLTRCCRNDKVATASVSVRGSVSRYTIGTFDPTQRVYVTRAADQPMELVVCCGLYTEGPAEAFFHAHMLLADGQGRVAAGRLFSETIVCAAEFDLQELLGPPLERRYDVLTGQMQLNFNCSNMRSTA